VSCSNISGSDDRWAVGGGRAQLPVGKGKRLVKFSGKHTAANNNSKRGRQARREEARSGPHAQSLEVPNEGPFPVEPFPVGPSRRSWNHGSGGHLLK